MKTICSLVAIALSFNLVGCDRIDLPSGIESFSVPEIGNVTLDTSNGNLSEVAPPKVIQQLSETLAKYQPKVHILSPRLGEIIQDTTVKVNVTVEDYPVFKDDRLAMGNHLHLILDNEPYGEIYNLEEPIVLTNLKPGTHSVRVLAEKPWHESFKNPEAFDLVSFSVLTETTDNQPDSDLPLLTYNQPTNVYTTEPILLDFYLQGVEGDNWQVKAKINEESFVIDEWQPIYLTGFKEGNNLVELELSDKDGKAIQNTFNQTIRLVTYKNSSSSLDTLAKLMQDVIPFEDAVAIAEQNYYIQPVGEPEELEPEELDIVTPTEEELEVEPELDVVEEPSAEEVTEDTTETTTVTTAEGTEETEVEETEESISEDITEIEEATEVSEEVSETISEKAIAPQEELRTSQNSEILAKDLIYKENVTTNSVIEENNSLKSEKSEIMQEIIPVPVPDLDEAVEITEITEDTAAVNPSESDTITIELPKPKKLKVPQWWKDLIAKIQTVFDTKTNN